MTKQALVVWGGWDGHQPKPCVDRFIPFLQQNGFAVAVHDKLDVYADAAVMGRLDLIVQCWTMGQLSKEQWGGLSAAVNGGCGLAGWHGGLCDSFRGHTDYLAMTGGQFLAHPGGIIDYEVHIDSWDDPIVAGIKDFRMKSEQYYMATDPGNLVLASTTFDGVHDALRKGVVMPTVWKRRWGKGRVFYSALGHVAADFDVPEARTIMERGLLWAAR
jgi:type 1 glutamine amidotransferase